VYQAKCYRALLLIILFFRVTAAQAIDQEALFTDLANDTITAHDVISKLLSSPSLNAENNLTDNNLSESLSELSQKGILNQSVIDKLGKALLEEIEQIIIEQAVSGASAHVKLAKLLLPEDNKYRISLERRLSVAERVEHFVATGYFSQLEAVSKELSDPEDLTFLNVSLRRLLHKSARELLDANQPEQAFLQLVRVSDEVRTDKTEELLVETIVAMQKKPRKELLEKWPFTEENLQNVVQPIESHDIGMRSVVADLLSSRVLFLVEKDAIDEVTSIFPQVIKRREDPNLENNLLRLNIALRANSDRARSFAQGRLREIEQYGGLGIMDRVRLFWAGYYGTFVIKLFYFSSCLLFLSLILSKFNRLFLKLKDIIMAYIDHQKIERAKRRKKLPGYMRDTVSLDEYSQLLEQFGLTDAASEDDIKKAYRDIVKRLHPDRMRDSLKDGNEVERFQELQETYDRIIEMKRARFGRR
jgi:hypothetical protein